MGITDFTVLVRSFANINTTIQSTKPPSGAQVVMVSGMMGGIDECTDV